MKGELSALIQRMVASAGPTFRRFWASVGFTIALTATLIINTTERHPHTTEELSRLSLALVAGILASWCAVLLWEARNEAPKSDSALMGNTIALALGAGATWVTFVMLEELTFVAVSRHVGVCFFLFLLFFIIPNWRSGRGLEMYVVKMFTQAVISVLFAAVLFIGLAAITATANYLFSLELSHRIYLHTWFVMGGVLAPLLFMAGIPEPNSVIPTGDYPKPLSNLIEYIITPVLSVYTFILYLYFAKILITREWPVGLVSHLVLWYAVATTAILLFTWPLTQSNKWARTFSGYSPKAVIPLLAMMFGSIGIRIKHYGITENRYYVLVLGLWLLGTMLYLNLSKARRSIVIPVTLAIVALVSVIGPWSSFSVSRWSQNRRLEGICAHYGMIQDGSIQPSAQVAQADRQEIAAIIQYFDIYHNLSDITLVPAGFTLDQFETVFGFPYMNAGVPTVHWYYYEAKHWSADITEFQYLFDYTRPYYEETISLSQDGIVAIYNEQDSRISISLDGNAEWQASFSDLIGSIQHKYALSGHDTFEPEDMVFEANSPHLRIRIVISSIRCEVYPDGREPMVNYVEFYLLLQRLDG